VVELGQRYPDWGARKLQVLSGAGGSGVAASTIHRILLREVLVRLGGIGMKRRCNGSSGAQPISFGKWILKVPREGRAGGSVVTAGPITAAI